MTAIQSTGMSTYRTRPVWFGKIECGCDRVYLDSETCQGRERMDVTGLQGRF